MTKTGIPFQKIKEKLMKDNAFKNEYIKLSFKTLETISKERKEEYPMTANNITTSGSTQMITFSGHSIDPAACISCEYYDLKKTPMSICSLCRVFGLDARALHNAKPSKTSKGKGIINSIEKVVFNPPATIIIFKDGRKFVSKARAGEQFDPEYGFSMALMKYFFESRGYFKRFLEQFIDENTQDKIEKYNDPSVYFTMPYTYSITDDSKEQV